MVAFFIVLLTLFALCVGVVFGAIGCIINITVGIILGVATFITVKVIGIRGVS